MTCPSETEILDVAPIDLLNGISKAWAEDMPFFTDVMKAHSVDTTFHWVNETGASARLTSGITLMATVTF